MLSFSLLVSFLSPSIKKECRIIKLKFDNLNESMKLKGNAFRRNMNLNFFRNVYFLLDLKLAY